MKTLIITSAALLATSAGCYAEGGVKTKKDTASHSAHTVILSPEQEVLFAEGKLNETVVKPMYTQTEQLIFTEQVRKTKKQKN
jgi:hypothetical protein